MYICRNRQFPLNCGRMVAPRYPTPELNDCQATAELSLLMKGLRQKCTGEAGGTAVPLITRKRQVLKA